MAGSVRAQVAFLNSEWRGRQEMPRIYSRKTRLESTTKRDVEIRDARPLHEAGELHLDKNGFVVVEHATSFDAFDDKGRIEREYYPEMNQLARRVTGADLVFTFPYHQVRSRNPEHFFDAYSLYVHCDFSDRIWPELANEIIRQSGSEERFPVEEWDFALYNLWRAVGSEVQRDPLLLIDKSTVDPSDLVEYQLTRGPGSKIGSLEVYAALPVYNEKQRLLYVSGLRPDEVLVFKQHDTRFPGPEVCPHSSFVDPTSPPNAPERRSIEVCMIGLFRKPEGKRRL